MDHKEEKNLELGPAMGEKTIGHVPDDGERPHRDLSHAELEARLTGKKAAIKARIDALEDEVLTSGQSIKDAVVKSPFVGVAGAVAAGLVVGLLVGGRRKTAARRAQETHAALIDRYVETLVADVRRAMARGKKADAALEAALQDRVPLIVYSPEREGGATRGLFRQALDLTFKTALGFAVKTVMDLLTQHIDVTVLQETLTTTQTEGPAGEHTTETTVTKTVEHAEKDPPG